MKEKATRIVAEFKNNKKIKYKNIDEQPLPNLLVIEVVVYPQEGVPLQLNSHNFY
ncbi:hypothetical protein [Bacillus cereus]